MKITNSVWWDDDLVTEAVQNSKSIAGVILFLDLAITGTAYSSAKRHIKRLNLSTDHFDPYKDRSVRTRIPELPFQEVFKENSKCDRSVVRKKVIKNKLIPYECARCNNSGMWMDEELSLQLEHKNGIRDDHRLENLEFLCPNCHTQTKTWGSRNRKVRASDKRKYGNRKDYTEAAIQRYIESQQDFIERVKKSDIDFSQLGWVKQTAQIIGQKPQRVKKWMQRCMPDFYDKHCFKRRSRCRLSG